MHFWPLSGGFQDAYTYNTRNEVFSNAQTGNVVLMSQNFMTGKWEAGLKYLFPLLHLLLGVLIAEQIRIKYKYAGACTGDRNTGEQRSSFCLL